MLGDAGEHYALSQFIFAGRAGSKMPEGWSHYDLALESPYGLVRVSVKTRRETPRWKAGSWFIFDERAVCEWLVLIFKPNQGPLRSWIIPFPSPASMRISERLQTRIRTSAIFHGRS